jgi:hypothetical protein
MPLTPLCTASCIWTAFHTRTMARDMPSGKRTYKSDILLSVKAVNHKTSFQPQFWSQLRL